MLYQNESWKSRKDGTASNQQIERLNAIGNQTKLVEKEREKGGDEGEQGLRISLPYSVRGPLEART